MTYPVDTDDNCLPLPAAFSKNEHLWKTNRSSGTGYRRSGSDRISGKPPATAQVLQCIAVFPSGFSLHSGTGSLRGGTASLLGGGFNPVKSPGKRRPIRFVIPLFFNSLPSPPLPPVLGGRGGDGRRGEGRRGYLEDCFLEESS